MVSVTTPVNKLFKDPDHVGRSPFVGLRFPPEDLDAIDILAEREGVGRSEMIRLLIEAGRKHRRFRDAVSA
jgi:hypothetical protein